MFTQFAIVGGSIRIHKSVFAKEMLFSNSLLKALLKWNSSGDTDMGSFKSDPGNNEIVIDFSDKMCTGLEDSPTEILKGLKAKYKDNIKGKVTCRGSMYAFEIDLNSDDGNIQYVLG
ncbi:MAG: hypothetical protein Q8942_15980 [Bacillota bacterium]|nr:hypothetical protein [Bacillota bacterium]